MITAREQDGQVRTAHALLTVSTTDFCWLIQLHGIATHVQITNAFSVRTQTKQYAIIVREQIEVEVVVHAQPTGSMTDLFWPTSPLGIANPVSMINAYSARTSIKIHVKLAKGQEEVERAVLVRLMDSMTRLCWLILLHGIVNPVKMINKYNGI